MKKKILFLMTLILGLAIAGCGEKTTPAVSDEGQNENTDIVVGFSQLGAESDWRSANTQSMKETFAPGSGYELIFEDGQQKQANQITAIRTFIQQDVDYIVLAPVTETGWDTVLEEARDANIQVIIVDRMVDVKDNSLFTCWVGSDFELESKKVAAWLAEYSRVAGVNPGDLHIVNIQGNIGASAQIGRTKGLEEASAKYGWDLLAEVSGEFTQAKGREVMGQFLETYPDIINVVYCENDNMALGAIEAIEAAGKTVGSNIKDGEIMILSFDGVNEIAREFAKNGKIACIGECNPVLGPRVKVLLEMLKYDMNPEKLSYVDEAVYSNYPDITSVIVDGRVYPITAIE